MPFWPCLSSRLITRCSSCSAVILIQSDAQRSTPKMPTLLAANQSRRSCGIGEAGKAEPRRMQLEVFQVLRLALGKRLPIGRLLDRDHTLKHVRARGGVGACSAASAEDATRCGGRPCGRPAPRASRSAAGPRRCGRCRRTSRERTDRRARQDFRRHFGSRAVVEGQDHLMVDERDRPRIGLQAHLEPALRADFDDARGSELVGSASLRSCGAHSGNSAASATAIRIDRSSRQDIEGFQRVARPVRKTARGAC